jgi:hypothetical protein
LSLREIRSERLHAYKERVALATISRRSSGLMTTHTIQDGHVKMVHLGPADGMNEETQCEISKQCLCVPAQMPIGSSFKRLAEPTPTSHVHDHTQENDQTTNADADHRRRRMADHESRSGRLQVSPLASVNMRCVSPTNGRKTHRVHDSDARGGTWRIDRRIVVRPSTRVPAGHRKSPRIISIAGRT